MPSHSFPQYYSFRFCRPCFLRVKLVSLVAKMPFFCDTFFWFKYQDDPYLSKRNKDTPKLSKHGFLEQIKSKAAAAAASTDKSTKKESTSARPESQSTSKKGKSTTAAGAPQWNALKDDYLLNPKKVRDAVGRGCF